HFAPAPSSWIFALLKISVAGAPAGGGFKKFAPIALPTGGICTVNHVGLTNATAFKNEITKNNPKTPPSPGPPNNPSHDKTRGEKMKNMTLKMYSRWSKNR